LLARREFVCLVRSSCVDGDDPRRGGGCGDDCFVRVGERAFEEGDVAVTVKDMASTD
jgi:hypothetical protein